MRSSRERNGPLLCRELQHHDHDLLLPLLPPVLGHQERPVGGVEAGVEAAEDPGEDERGEVRRGGEDDGGLECRDTGGHDRPPRAEPAPAVASQQVADHEAQKEAGGCKAMIVRRL